MQEFAQWMTTLQQHRSTASSYAETDCADSDSDSDSPRNDCQCRLEAKRKFVDAQTRTAPISIPSSSRPHPHLCASVVESQDLSYHADKRLLRAGRYLHENDDDQELDEDDPAFYGNLAFFDSRNGASQRARVLKHSVHPFQTKAPTSPTGVDACDDDIFAMEL